MEGILTRRAGCGTVIQTIQTGNGIGDERDRIHQSGLGLFLLEAASCTDFGTYVRDHCVCEHDPTSSVDF